jgi:hypothetical protein
MPVIEEIIEDTTETKQKSYDDMTKEEREAYDAELRAKEADEQSSKRSPFFTHGFILPQVSSQELPYQWKQELGEVDVTVPLPKGTRARDLAVKIMKKKLSAGLKGQDPILEGELCQEIKVEESTWTLGKFIHWSRRRYILSLDH